MSEDVKLAVDRPRNVRWHGPKGQEGYLQFKWSEDSADQVPKGIRIEVKAKDGRTGRHDDNEACTSYETCRDRGIRVMQRMMDEIDPD
ncbi:hypothetical protein [Pseudomonas auratipiscis]|uniref:Uncharacterized protein n=1 Tax=Pseudomonas auratipiscis TaxID=3115853 RepID=A0AB35WUZ6_9PSED|nr:MULTISPECIES: hypothetical protein [unclassified Pseudomonas]MEE1866900.1 hypothetical protein [Pseudomonas sp. 120P]MEE1960598.1 hypothetical protein [Pseudomonas sp. 119P]